MEDTYSIYYYIDDIHSLVTFISLYFKLFHNFYPFLFFYYLIMNKNVNDDLYN